MSQIPWDQIENDYKQNNRAITWDPAEAVSKIEKSDYEGAKQDLKKAIESYPHDEHAINLYVHCLRKSSHSIVDIQTAKSLLEGFIKNNQVGTMTLFNMGTLFFALELFNEALEQFEKVYSIDPANSKVLYNIGLCNHMLMKDDIALSYYKQTIDLGNRTKQALLNISVLLCKHNRNVEAKPYLEELKKLYGDDPKVLNNLSVTMASDSNEKDAVRENFELIRKQNNEHPTATYNEAVFEYHESNLENSAKLFQRVGEESASIGPIKVFAQLNNAVVYEKLNRNKEARRFYLKIIDHLGRFIDVSDVQQRVLDLQNAASGGVATSDKKRGKKSGRSSLIAYDSDLMDFKNNFSMGDELGLNREYSNLSRGSPASVEQSQRRISEDTSSPELRNEGDSPKGNNLENIKEEDEEKRLAETSMKVDNSMKADTNSLQKHLNFNEESKNDINNNILHIDNLSPQPNDREFKSVDMKDELSPIKIKDTSSIDHRDEAPSKDMSEQVSHIEEWSRVICEEKIESDPQNYEAHLRLGMIFMDEKIYSSAIDYFTKCLQLKGIEEQERAVKCLVDCYIYSGEFEKAMHTVDELPKTRATKTDYLMRKGLAYEGLGNTNEARQLLIEATQEEPDNPQTHLRLGSLLVRLDSIQDGIRSLKRACDLHPENVESRIKLAEAYIMAGDSYLDEALKHFKFVYETDKNDYDALIGMSQVYEKQGDTQKAISYAQLASKLSEAPINCLFFLGTLYYKIKELRKAEEQFRSVLKRDVTHVGATTELAAILVYNKDFDKARKYFKHAIKLDSHNLTANMLYGKILHNHFGEDDEAIECYLRVIKADETQFKAHYQLGLIYTEQRSLKEAERAFKACLRNNEKYGPAWKGLGQVYFDNGDHEKALENLTKALDVDPQDVEAMMQIGNCQYELQDFDAAIKAYQRALKQEKTANVLYNLGNTHFMKEDHQKAIEYYKQSIELDDRRAECYYNLGNAFVIIQDYVNAIEPFKKACELDPQNVAAFYNLGNAYLFSKELNSALKMFEDVLKVDQNVEWRFRIAFVLNDYGEANHALHHIEECLKVRPKDSQTLFFKAQILEKLNKINEAIEVLTLITEETVGEEKVADKINELKAKL